MDKCWAICKDLQVGVLITTCGWLGTLIRNITQWLSSKESACNAGDLGSIPVLGRSPGGGHGNPLQHSYLENSMDRGVWQATVHGATKSQTPLNS